VVDVPVVELGLLVVEFGFVVEFGLVVELGLVVVVQGVVLVTPVVEVMPVVDEVFPGALAPLVAGGVAVAVAVPVAGLQFGSVEVPVAEVPIDDGGVTPVESVPLVEELLEELGVVPAVDPMF
jgi:hypothetical protein